MSAVGVIFSNIHDNNIPELSRIRTTASIPFGGRYRLIDFALSNMVNFGITTVGIITKNNYQSLMDHLGSGKDWDLARKSGGIIMLPPYGANENKLYNTRLEALKGIRGFLTKRNEDHVVLTDCDGVVRFNFNDMLNYHIQKQADITLAYHNQQITENPNFFTVKTDTDGRIYDIQLCPPVSQSPAEVYINIMVIGRQFLINLIDDAVTHNQKSFSKDILVKNVKSLNIYGYNFKGYYGGIDNLQMYYAHNMDLLNKDIRNELFGERDIFTKVRDSAPSKYGENAVIKNSLISDGCVVEGTVENSILFRGVKVGKGSVIKNSIIMQDAFIAENVSLNCVITDKNVIIKDRRVLSGCDVQPFFIPKGTML